MVVFFPCTCLPFWSFYIYHLPCLSLSVSLLPYLPICPKRHACMPFCLTLSLCLHPQIFLLPLLLLPPHTPCDSPTYSNSICWENFGFEFACARVCFGCVVSVSCMRLLLVLFTPFIPFCSTFYSPSCLPQPPAIYCTCWDRLHFLPLPSCCLCCFRHY